MRLQTDDDDDDDDDAEDEKGRFTSLDGEEQ